MLNKTNFSLAFNFMQGVTKLLALKCAGGVCLTSPPGSTYYRFACCSTCTCSVHSLQFALMVFHSAALPHNYTDAACTVW